MRKSFLKKIPILFYSLFILTSCYSLPYYELDPNVDYSTFNEYHLDSIKDMYSKEENEYAVYLYRVDCDACNKNKNALLGYLSEYEDNIRHFKVYLYNIVNLKLEGITYKTGEGMSVDEIRNELVNNKVSTLEDTIIENVPSLYVISNGRIIDYQEGIECIRYIFETNFDSRNYEIDFNEFNLKDLNEFYLKEEDIYYVYLFSLECPYCRNIKGVVMNYMDKIRDNLNVDSPKLYFYDMKPSSSEEGKVNRSYFTIPSVESTDEFKEYINLMKEKKVSSTKDTYYAYIPSLYIVENNVFKDCILGSSTLLEYLS